MVGILKLLKTHFKTPCNNIKKLQNDLEFKSKMASLINSARQWSFEKLHTIYNKTSPTSTANFDYQDFQGNPQTPTANYIGNTNMQGIIHSHYEGLISIFSIGDLQDLYEKMLNNQITDNFFIAVVSESSAHLINIHNRNDFIQFGNTYLNKQEKIDDLMRMFEKLDIKNNNDSVTNENGFLKFLSKFNIGLNLSTIEFGINTPPSANLFNTWNKRRYNTNTREFETSTCE